ncbi:MAG: hypothetical protein L3J39_11145 [Verrucomicrobiales bacterium]|nr:hypothetical protein [Verrucomicrobiales bacterium]
MPPLRLLLIVAHPDDAEARCGGLMSIYRQAGHVVKWMSFSVTVPAIVPDTPALSKDPVIAYMADLFTRPTPLRTDIAIDVDAYRDNIIEMFSCHASQAFEWLPFNRGESDSVPESAEQRKTWMHEHFLP